MAIQMEICTLNGANFEKRKFHCAVFSVAKLLILFIIMLILSTVIQIFWRLAGLSEPELQSGNEKARFRWESGLGLSADFSVAYLAIILCKIERKFFGNKYWTHIVDIMLLWLVLR